jgi:hypothetical protein
VKQKTHLQLPNFKQNKTKQNKTDILSRRKLKKQKNKKSLRCIIRTRYMYTAMDCCGPDPTDPDQNAVCYSYIAAHLACARQHYWVPTLSTLHHHRRDIVLKALCMSGELHGRKPALANRF